MAILVTDSELASFMSGIEDHFDTFSAHHTLVVIKKPQEIIENINSNDYYFGFGSSSNLNNITYQAISGVFPCMILESNKSDVDTTIGQVPTFIPNEEKIIKVRQDARDFIENGIINERIIVDGETYTKISNASPKSYGSLKYYYFTVKESN